MPKDSAIKKGVIMVAGGGTRLLPVTEDVSKCMLPVAGKPIMQHSLECMDAVGVTNVCIVVRPQFRKHIESYFGKSFGSCTLRYVEQDLTKKGTAAAVETAKSFIGAGPALVMAGDIITECSDVSDLIKAHFAGGRDTTMLLTPVKEPSRFGVVSLEGNEVVDIIEKPEKPKSNLINASVYILGKKFMDEVDEVQLSSRGEYELTTALYVLSATGSLGGHVAVGYWNDVGTPWDLLDANEHFMKSMKGAIKGKVDNCTLKGEVVVEEGAEVFNSYIEGPCFISKGAKIGPFAQIRKHSYIGPSCEIGGFTVVKNSILMEGVKAKHLSYIGDSIIGHHTNFGSSTQVANLRFDHRTVQMNICGKIHDSGRVKMGCVVGPNVNFGVNSTVLPGRAIGGGSIVGSGVIVSDDVPPKTRIICKQNLERSEL